MTTSCLGCRTEGALTTTTICEEGQAHTPSKPLGLSPQVLRSQKQGKFPHYHAGRWSTQWKEMCLPDKEQLKEAGSRRIKEQDLEGKMLLLMVKEKDVWEETRKEIPGNCLSSPVLFATGVRDQKLQSHAWTRLQPRICK